MVDLGLVVTQVITGISIGSRLFLVAVGLSLIFGVLDVLNFTHGVLYMVGAYVSIMLVEGLTVGFTAPILGFVGLDVPALGFWPGVVVALVVVGLLGAAIEAGFIRRVYDREPLDQLLLTFAFVLMLTDAVRFLFGSGQFSIDPPAMFNFTFQLGTGYSIPAYRAFVIVLSVVVMAVLFAVLRTTNVGRLVRATSSDRDMARLLGIDVPKLYTGVFFVGCALAGIGGAFAAPLQSINPDVGNQVIINAFVVSVIGGLGSFTGAFVGAMLIGVSIAVGSLFVGGAGQLFPFVAMILVLVLKPEGLFGGAEA